MLAANLLAAFAAPLEPTPPATASAAVFRRPRFRAGSAGACWGCTCVVMHTVLYHENNNATADD